MINRFFFLFLALLFLIGNASLSMASDGFYTHTQYTPELKPASFVDVDNSFQTASVCFLGVGDCTQGNYVKGDEDYHIDTAKQCQNEGFVKNNCNSVQEPDGLCPYNSSYIKGCKCKSGLVTCSSPKLGVGASCNGQYASCTCPPTVSLTNPNDRCTQYCDGKCIAKTCSPNSSETGCSYGTQSCSNGCGGTRSCCKACYPYGDETGCSYGTYSCSNGCGGTRRCCSANPCNNVTAVSIPSNASCSAYYSTCSSKCSAWTCNSGYSRSGNSCVKNISCGDGGYWSVVPNGRTCTPVTYQGLNCYANCRCQPVSCSVPSGCRSYSGGECFGTITHCLPYTADCEYGAAYYYCCPR